MALGCEHHPGSVGGEGRVVIELQARDQLARVPAIGVGDVQLGACGTPLVDENTLFGDEDRASRDRHQDHSGRQTVVIQGHGGLNRNTGRRRRAGLFLIVIQWLRRPDGFSVRTLGMMNFITDDLRNQLNPEGVLFYKVWNGHAIQLRVQIDDMPAFRDKLSRDEAWAVVEYLKVLRTPRQ